MRLPICALMGLLLASGLSLTGSVLYSVTDLGTLGGHSSGGEAINNAGQVTGYADNRQPPSSHAFLYSNGQMMDLGTLGGISSSGTGINDAGQVTGDADTATGLRMLSSTATVG